METPEETPVNELSNLVKKDKRRSSVIALEQTFSRSSEVARRESVQLMGITGFDTKEEMANRKNMKEEMEELKRLGDLDFD